MDHVLAAVRDNWSWALPSPESIIRSSKFGNLLVSAADGSVWRICPEELSCAQVAANTTEVEQLMADPKFRVEWEMARLVEQAESVLGVQADGRCFCLKVPGVVGGEYAIGNIGTITLVELISFAGDVGRQIKDLPDGTEIEFKFD